MTAPDPDPDPEDLAARVTRTPLLKKLLEYLRRGELLDLIPEIEEGQRIDEAVMRSWGETQTVDANDLRDLLRGRICTDPDSRGLRLRGAVIRGRLDLNYVTTTVKLTLLDCLLEEGITADTAHLASLSLQRCILCHAEQAALFADGLHTYGEVSLEGSTIAACTTDGAVRLVGAVCFKLICSGANIDNPAGSALYATGLQVRNGIDFGDGFTAHGSGDGGAVRLVGARITGWLTFAGARITNPTGPAVDADQLQVDGGDVVLTAFVPTEGQSVGFTAHGTGELGAMRLVGAHITGQLSCWAGTTIRNDSGPALYADGLRAHSVYLGQGFTAVGTGNLGTVRLVGAHLTDQLTCPGAIITNESGPALYADRLRADGVAMTSPFAAVGAGKLGAVRLPGAHITGQLDCAGAIMTNLSGPALNANHLQADGGALLWKGFTANGASEDGAVRLPGAHITGQFDCSGATITNPSGPALNANHLQADGGAFLRKGFTANGDSERGSVRIIGAHITGQLDCSGATITNPSGPALHAEDLRASSANFGKRFTARGAGEDGAIRLVGAHITGQLDCSGATITNPSGPALHAENLQVDGDVLLREAFSADGDGDRGALRLSGTHIGGRLDCSGATFSSHSTLAVDLRWAEVTLAVLMLPTSLEGGIDLSYARVGAWYDAKKTWPARVSAVGFVYDAIDANDATVTDRLRYWLASSGYQPQPYEQLAAVYRRDGDEHGARTVMIGKQKARRTESARWPTCSTAGQLMRRTIRYVYARLVQVWSCLLRWTIGYGYRPGLALVPLIALLIAGTRVFEVAHRSNLLRAPSKADTAQPDFNSFRYTVDLLLPVANFKQRDTFVAFGWAAWTSFGFIFAGWLLALVVVAGLSGIFKRG
jgi:hypothetical protein